MAEDRAEGTLRVVQLNAGSMLEPDWETRRHTLVAWLDLLDPDVVCLQEVWRNGSGTDTAAWVVDHAAGDWFWRFGGDAFMPEIWPDPTLAFGSTILSRWPIETHRYQRLPIVEDPGNDPVVESAPWELLHVRTAGLDVFSTHLAPAPTHGRHRVRQVMTIDDHVRRVRGDLDALPPFGEKREGMPAVLCGDFNAEPDSDEIRWLRGLTAIEGRTTYWVDAWSEAGDGPGLTSDPTTNPVVRTMGVTHKRIDYVFVGDGFQRAGDAGRILSARLAFDASLTGHVASDHYGLAVDIVWPTRPPGALR
jgi:endonuclease/exonuclease/phosphatase family metal-dependent hydrolase